MAASGALVCCKTLCCILVVFVNVISIVLGVLIAILGILMLWGSIVIHGLSNIAQDGSMASNQTAVNSGVFGSQVSLGNYFSSLAALSGCAAGLLIAFGVLVVVVSCIGCFGACIGIPTCLIIYAVCVGLLLIGQAIVIIIWFANSSLFKNGIRTSLEQQVQKYRGIQSDSVDSTSLNMIQAMFGCCGVRNGSDFNQPGARWNRTHSLIGADNRTVVFNLTYPVTCCKFNLNKYELADRYCPYNGSSSATVSNYQVGCYEKIWLVIDTHWQLNRFFYALCGCLGLELILIIGAIIICQAKRAQMLDVSGSHAEVEYKMVQQKA